MKMKFGKNEDIQFDKDKVDREKLGKFKNGDNFDKYLKISNLIMILFFILNNFINTQDIYFKESFINLISIIFIIQVIATTMRVIYKISTMKGKSRSFFMLASACTISTFLIKGGLSMLDNKMIECLTYKDNEKNVVIYLDTENNDKEAIFKEINLLMMKNLSATEITEDDKGIDNGSGKNNIISDQGMFLQGDSIDFKDVGKYLKDIDRDTMNKKFNETYQIDNQMFGYAQDIIAKFSADNSELKELVIRADIATYGRIRMIGTKIGKFMYNVTSSYPNTYFEKVGDTYQFRKHSPDGTNFYFVLNLIVDENEMIREVNYGNFAVG